MDGCGKGTQIKRLADCFESRQIKFWQTVEPTESSDGKEIRQVLANKGCNSRGGKMSRDDLQLMYIRDRAHHRVEEAERLEGGVVVSDRDWESTLAYYIAFGDEYKAAESAKWIIDRHEEIFRDARREFFTADLTLVIDITVEEAFERQQKFFASQGKQFDYFEDDIDKRRRIRKAYRSLPKLLDRLGISNNIRIVNGMDWPEKVTEEILAHILPVITQKEERPY